MRIAMILPVLLLVSLSALAQPVTATATLPYDMILPGVPFDIGVSIKNTGDQPVTVGLLARLVVTLPDGTRFVAKDTAPLEPRGGSSMHPDTYVALAPNESRDFAITWSYATIPNWSHFPQFSAPGDYPLHLELLAVKPPQNFVGTLKTTSVTLHRLVSPGEDAALWQQMLSATGGRWSDDSLSNSKEGQVILKEILAVHPASGYYPYALLLAPALGAQPPTVADVDRMRDAAGRFRTSPAYPYLVYRVAEVADSIALHASWNHDAKVVAQFSALAEQYYRDVERNVTNPALLEAAREAADRVHARTERAAAK